MSRLQHIACALTLFLVAGAARAGPPPTASDPGFRWSDSAARQLLDAVSRAREDGLEPTDYSFAELRAADRGAAADALRSRVLLRLASDLHLGRLDPELYVPAIEPRPQPHTGHIIALLGPAVDAGRLAQALDSLRPSAPPYAGLRRALATYRSLAARGGWATIPAGPSLHPGERSPRVPALRARLAASGDLRDEPASQVDSDRYDEGLVNAVRHAQLRHRLSVDGVVGTRTLAALNVPVEARIDQIRVNLERLRWLLHDLPPEYVLVDIAGFELRLIRQGREQLRSRVVVGKPYRRTPIFRSAISYLEFAPTWTVPPTILRNDVLPAIRKDPAYLDRKNMRLVDAAGGEVDPAGIEWSRYTGHRVPPFMIRQDPGPENPLGRVKFMFPNVWHVYLHDSPAREMFARSERAFSSGCIRVEQAARLAHLLLEDQGWQATAVEQALQATSPRRVDLRNRVPVMLYYWTVSLEQDGEVAFKRDIYGHDDAVLQGLRGHSAASPSHTPRAAQP